MALLAAGIMCVLWFAHWRAGTAGDEAVPRKDAEGILVLRDLLESLQFVELDTFLDAELQLDPGWPSNPRTIEVTARFERGNLVAISRLSDSGIARLGFGGPLPEGDLAVIRRYRALMYDYGLALVAQERLPESRVVADAMAAVGLAIARDSTQLDATLHGLAIAERGILLADSGHQCEWSIVTVELAKAWRLMSSRAWSVVSSEVVTVLGSAAKGETAAQWGPEVLGVISTDEISQARSALMRVDQLLQEAGSERDALDGLRELRSAVKQEVGLAEPIRAVFGEDGIFRPVNTTLTICAKVNGVELPRN